ncbi:MAG: hypothetical protein V8Q54_09265 [Alistipes senegalensis]
MPQDAREGVCAGLEQAFRVNYPFERLNGYYTSSKTGFLEIYTTVNMLYDIEGNISNFMLININNHRDQPRPHAAGGVRVRSRW